MSRFLRSSLASRRAAGASFAALAAILLVATVAAAQMGILDDPNRTDEERARDAGSKPLQVYQWLGIESGMTVGDIVPAGGYNTFLLAKVVGMGGHVVAAPAGDRLAGRFTSAGIDNVEVMGSLDGVPADSVDVYICVRNVHDMMIPEVAQQYNMMPDPIMQAAYRSLKPGGIFGVVDARTDKMGVDSDTHRVNQQAVIDFMEGYGFEYVDSSDLLANPDDDHSMAEFNEPGGRYTLDRMLLKFRKPAM
jgi:predicted methyltransferase